MKSKQISLEERRGSQDRKSSSLPPYILESKLHEAPLHEAPLPPYILESELHEDPLSYILSPRPNTLLEISLSLNATPAAMP